MYTNVHIAFARPARGTRQVTLAKIFDNSLALKLPCLQGPQHERLTFFVSFESLVIPQNTPTHHPEGFFGHFFPNYHQLYLHDLRRNLRSQQDFPPHQSPQLFTQPGKYVPKFTLSRKSLTPPLPSSLQAHASPFSYRSSLSWFPTIRHHTQAVGRCG
jgi:hypothetical protein